MARVVTFKHAVERMGGKLMVDMIDWVLHNGHSRANAQ
jgi:hypothetical protein